MFVRLFVETKCTWTILFRFTNIIVENNFLHRSSDGTMSGLARWKCPWPLVGFQVKGNSIRKQSRRHTALVCHTQRSSVNYLFEEHTLHNGNLAQMTRLCIQSFFFIFLSFFGSSVFFSSPSFLAGSSFASLGFLLHNSWPDRKRQNCWKERPEEHDVSNHQVEDCDGAVDQDQLHCLVPLPDPHVVWKHRS